MKRSALMVTVLLVLMSAAVAQQAPNYTYGNRPIDLLPKSETARAEGERGWGEAEAPRAFEVALHAKDLFRVGRAGLERLCVIEARRPAGPAEARPLQLALVAGGDTVWQASGDWIGTNQRMRPYWLPVRADAKTTFVLRRGGDVVAECPASLGEGAPAAMVELSEPQPVPAADAGFALLSAAELVVTRDTSLQVRIGLARPMPGPLRVAVRELPGTQLLRSWDCGDELARTFGFSLRDLPIVTVAPGRNGKLRLECELMAGERGVAREEYTLHVADGAGSARFGARTADLRYTLPIKDGDRTRTWEELWGQSDKRDVVVSFENSVARLVFWRGCSYVPCWALPEAWLTYEWLEAEPYFFEADDCVEPLQDRDCKYSRVEIVSSTPARAVVKWSYALTDFQGKIIQDEHAEEVWTLYPDGVGTRYLRGFYKGGWHENQEFIVINRPGRRASQALDPQALTFYNLQGDVQKPVWPKPGFSLEGWPQVITVVNIGQGPKPFMVTLDAPQQVKVWANPYLDKPDIFNSYPHWPVTRGMRTSWLSDPADFARPTHSNLANLVNAPIRETEEEKDFLWLIGVAGKDEDAVAAAGSWLKPGRITAGLGAVAGEYSQIERAYVVMARPQATQCSFTLAPVDGGTITNPAFVIKDWTGRCMVEVPGADRVVAGQEGEQLVVWIRGQFDKTVQVTLHPVTIGF